MFLIVIILNSLNTFMRELNAIVLLLAFLYTSYTVAIGNVPTNRVRTPYETR